MGEWRQVGAQGHESLTCISLLQELEVLLLADPEAHHVSVGAGGQDKSVAGLLVVDGNGAIEQLFRLGPSALQHRRSKGSYCRALEVKAAFAAYAFGGGLVAHVGERLDEDAGDLFPVVAKVGLGFRAGNTLSLIRGAVGCYRLEGAI